MISYLTYKIIHLTGVFLVLFTLGSLLVLPKESSTGWQKQLKIWNGVGLLLAFVAGFGLLARLGVSWPWQFWVFAKVIIWLVLGAMIALRKRVPDSQKILWWLTLVLVILAAVFANLKPF